MIYHPIHIILHPSTTLETHDQQQKEEENEEEKEEEEKKRAAADKDKRHVTPTTKVAKEISNLSI